MKISLITSLYRSDAHMAKWKKNVTAMAKKLGETGIGFELVVVANDPTEQESQTLSQLSALPWTKVIIVPRESLYASWNRGLRESTGEICGFWNVDDIRLISGVTDAASLISKGAELVYFPFIYMRYIKLFGISILSKVKIVRPPAFDKKEFSTAMHCGPFFMFSKEFFDKVGEFNSSYKIAGDYEWCTRAAEIGTFEKSKRLGGIFTNDGTTLSGSKSSVQEQENAKVLRARNKNT